MSKTARRLFVAALFSASGFGGTITWYKLSEVKDTTVATSKPIARLVSSTNDVQKKSVHKIIWEPISDNEVLHVGEAIRTAANAEARIEFLGSLTAIDLEPDSAIVLEESNGKLSLDFLKGNILVKADTTAGAADSGITLKTGGKNIELGKSEFTLGKTKTGGLDVQLLKGNVAGLQNASNNKIKILSPQPNEPMYVNAAANEFAQIQWQPLPTGYEIFVEAGDARDDLKPVAGAMSAGEKGTVNANMKMGRTFFRLVARSTNPAQPEMTSPVIRSSVLAKSPPVPLQPERDTVVNVNIADPNIEFLWSNPAGFSKVIIEIATTADLKQKVKTEHLENITMFTFRPEKSGFYYWRVSGALSGRKEVVSSEIQRFKLNVLNELMAPELEFPKQNEKFPTEQIKDNGVILSWKATPGAERYRIVIEKAIAPSADRKPASKERVFEDEGKTLQSSAKNLKAGTYSWTVTSIGNKNNTSKPSEERTFTVHSLPILQWADGKLEEDYYYVTLKPTVTIKWQKGDPKATSWIAKFTRENSETPPITQKFISPGGDMNLASDGRYAAEIEAYDDRGNLVARSQKRDMKISAAPLLPAPEFASNLPKEIEASGNGAANIQWNEVQGANEYVIQVKTPDGKTTKEYNFKTKVAALSGLMPGEYKVSMKSVDIHGRQGPNGEERLLKVPSQSNVRAPKLKGVKVK